MIKEVKKGKVVHQVIRNDQSFEIEPILTIKYHIHVGQTFENKEWNLILKENQYYYYDRIALAKLKKALTKNELINFLIEKGAKDAIINKLVTKYLDYGYIDDNKYVKLFIDIRKSKDGPKLIFKKLKDKGVLEEVINKHLTNLDEEAIITNFVVSKFKQAKRQTAKQTITKVKQHLVNKGYSPEIINNVIANNSNIITVDELSLLEKEYDKLFNRKKVNIDLNEFKYKTRNKLLLKGYNIENIQLIESNYLK